MAKRINLEEKPYNGILIGEKVMYLATSYQHTYMDFGFYRGMSNGIPVVERFDRERKWNYKNDEWVQDEHWTLVSKRVYLQLGRVYSTDTIGAMIANTRDRKYIEKLIENDK